MILSARTVTTAVNGFVARAQAVRSFVFLWLEPFTFVLTLCFFSLSVYRSRMQFLRGPIAMT